MLIIIVATIINILCIWYLTFITIKAQRDRDSVQHKYNNLKHKYNARKNRLFHTAYDNILLRAKLKEALLIPNIDEVRKLADNGDKNSRLLWECIAAIRTHQAYNCLMSMDEVYQMMIERCN